MRKKLIIVIAFLLMLLSPTVSFAVDNQQPFQLGDDQLLESYHSLIDGKNIGLIINQSGINSQGKSMIEVLSGYKGTSLKALFAPEHGIDGLAKAGDYVESYTDEKLGIPVYSLYGDTRMPTEEMLKGIDVLVFDIQDIGARSYTYISTLNYCMIAAQKYNKQIVVLDRPNPLGGQLVDGPVLEDSYKSFVGIDNIPMAHGMTIAELAQFFNRKIGADLKIVPMQGYTRNLQFADTGLTWIPTSPYIPDLTAALSYMATGLGEGTGIYQDSYFKWIGGKGIHSKQFADLLTSAKLPGVSFTPEDHEGVGGVRLSIVDSRSFNPVKTGLYALFYAHQLSSFAVPVSKDGKLTMFDKIMGNGKISEDLIAGVSPQEMEKGYQDAVAKFKEDRKPYLLYAEEMATQTPIPKEWKKTTLDGGIFKTDKSYIPFNSVFTQLGYKVSWNAESGLISAQKDQWNIMIDPHLSPMKVTVNGQTMGSEIDPFIRNGVTYIPAFFVTYLESGSHVERGDAIRLLTQEQQIDVNYEMERITIKKQPPSGKVAYLTFDDGPSALTPQILDILKEYDVPATFFVVGRNVLAHEDILKREYEEGHAIGNHSFSHDYNSIYRSSDAFFADLDRGANAIKGVTGENPTIIRFPGGSNNTVSKHAQVAKGTWIMEDLVQQVKEQGYSYFDWNASTGDADSNSYSVAYALANVKAGVGNGSKKELIILAHDAPSKMNTVRALPDIIQYLKVEGYNFGTLDENTPAIAFLK